MHSLIIFASGKGSNAQVIIDYFKANGKAKVTLIVTNKADAGVLDIAQAESIDYLVTDRKSFAGEEFIELLQKHNPSLIILAGFLWKIPDTVIHAFPGKIINMHPSLLPKHGGKGMYGHHVHNAVLETDDTESGISIHYVNEVYDSGNIILQARCDVKPRDTAEELASRIHQLEHFYYPRTIEFLLNTMVAEN